MKLVTVTLALAMLAMGMSAPLNAQIGPPSFNPNTISSDEWPEMLFGERPPVLEFGSWISGGPEEITRGKVYAILFFSVNSAASRMSIPQMNRLAGTYASRGFKVIGVSTDKDIAALRAYVKAKGENMGFPVATLASDDAYKSWLWGTRFVNLPLVCVLDRDGGLVWWGHPFNSTFESTLPVVLDGTHQLVRMRVGYRHAMRVRRLNWDRQESFWKSYQAGRWDECLSTVDEIRGTLDESFYQEYTMKFDLLYKHKGEKERALGYAEHTMQTHLRHKHVSLAHMAAVILDDTEATKSALAKALKLAERARNLTSAQDAEVMALLSRAYHRTGEKELAIEAVTKAINLAGGTLKQELQKQLASYQ